MGNGALPNGPSYRAHPRLYHFRHDEHDGQCPLSRAKRKWRGPEFNVAYVHWSLRGNRVYIFCCIALCVTGVGFVNHRKARGIYRCCERRLRTPNSIAGAVRLEALMEEYRAYVVGPRGRIIDRVDIRCSGKEDARRLAKIAVDGPSG